MSPKERFELFNTLNRLTESELEQIIFALSPPPGVMPGKSASQGEKVAVLLNWAESLTGTGLKKVNTLVKGLPDKLGAHSQKLDYKNELNFASPPNITPENNPSFIGREKEFSDLDSLILRGQKIILIQAKGGVGKTTLARKYLQQRFSFCIEFQIAQETRDIASAESLVEEKLRQLGEEPSQEFFVSLDRLKRKLQKFRIGILIDNLDSALDERGKFIQPCQRYIELLRVLDDPTVSSTTLITSRERLYEGTISACYYRLSGLSLKAWERFFESRFALENKSLCSFQYVELAELHKAFGGNAKAMDILCGVILMDYAGKINAYWQSNKTDLLIESPLEDLVRSQFYRLKNSDLSAFKLLCRMGCLRYQDIPTISLEGIFSLMWDIPEHRRKRVFKSLKERMLVEFYETDEYWLHPVIRAEAIRFLRESLDWEQANKEIAHFWEKMVQEINQIEDILVALEAYYHYVNINEIEQAARVITKRFESQFYGKENLAYLCYRLGLITNIIEVMTPVIDKLEPSYYSGEFNFLGSPGSMVTASFFRRNMLIT
jgi:hypothetical protein